MSLVRGQQSDTESAIVCVSGALIGISSCSIDAQACCLFCVCKFDQTCAACAGQQSRSLMQQSCVFRKSFASHPLSCLLIVAHPPSPLTPHVLASNQDFSDSNRVFFENRLRLIHCFFLFHYLLCCLLLTPHSPPRVSNLPLLPLSIILTRNRFSFDCNRCCNTKIKANTFGLLLSIPFLPTIIQPKK